MELLLVIDAVLCVKKVSTKVNSRDETVNNHA